MKLDSFLKGGVLAFAAAAAIPAVGQPVPGAVATQQSYPAQAYPAQAYAAAPYAQPSPGYPQTAQQSVAGYYQQAPVYPPAAAQVPVQPYAAAPSAPINRYALLQEQGSGARDAAPAGSGSRQLPPPTESVQPVAPALSTPPAGAPVYGSSSVLTGTPAAAPVVQHNHAPAPAPASWNSYTAAPAGGACATGNCGATGASYDAGYYGGESCGVGGQALTAGCFDARPKRQWFAGFYGLYMSRDNPPTKTSAFLVDSPPVDPYYPQAGRDRFFTTGEADVDFQGGGEVRFGSTFGHATTCGGCYAYQPFAWELGYWGLAEDSSQAVLFDNTIAGTDRIYGAIDYTGIEYDRTGTGAAYRPLNDYFDYQAPIDSGSANDIRVLAVRVRQSFSAQNLELNFWRFGQPAVAAGGAAIGGGLGSGLAGYAGGAGCGSAGYGGSCGSGACGSGSCGTGACGSGACGAYACAPVAPKRRFFINGLAGVRFLRLDENFGNDVFFASTAGGSTDSTVPPPDNFPTDGPNADQYVFTDTQVDNDLVGFQLGCSMNCLIGCRWSLFCDTNFGIYGNDIETYQRVFSGANGVARFVGTTGAAEVRGSKTDVSFLGEARCGGGYQLSEKCRLTAAYRVIAVTGVALANQQHVTPINETVYAAVDSNGSILIHGLQLGAEFKY